MSINSSWNNQPAALAGGTIYPGPAMEPVRGGVVLLRDGRIAGVESMVPPDVPVLDCAGCTITAGFWNSHIHFFERKWADAASIPAEELGRQLEEMLTRFGFTSVFDLSSMWENTLRLRGRIESGEVAGPRIRSTGEGMVPPGAVPPEAINAFMGVMKTPMPEVTEPEQATATARRLLDAGVDGIKLFASSPRSAALSEGVFQAAATEAHAAGKPVFVHPNSGADVLTAVRGGADIVAHTTPHSGPWEDAILAAMKERGVALTPTLTLWKYFARHDRLTTQERITSTATGQLKAWTGTGGTVLFGNDLGAVEYDPTEEYVLMEQAGMSFRQILDSLTTAPAERFGDGALLGRIAEGYVADLVVLNGDPAADIRALSQVRYTLRDGKVIHQST